MNTKRIIPCLDVKDGRVVKGVNFVNFRDAGDPVEIAAFYEKENADELVFLDITATSEARSTIADTVARTAEQITIPLTVGGGIRSVDDVRRVLKSGASKISINSAALAEPDLINRAADEFGSSAVVVAIDVKRRANTSDYDVYVSGGSVNTSKDAIEWAIEVEKRGAGEILLTSMSTDGVKTGYDIPITAKIADLLGIPLIASGGAGALEHFYEALTVGKADAVLAASVFHYREISVMDVKRYLRDKNVPVRY